MLYKKMISNPNVKILKSNHIIYSLNEEEKTAEVVGEDYTTRNIIIPHSINYKEQEFIVTSIHANAFEYSETIDSIQFASDSEVRLIEKKAFFESYIKKISLPSSVIELGNGWCSNMCELKEIVISPNNPRYKIYDDFFIIGKSSIEKENFDVLVFCFKFSKTIKIPNFIEIIGPYAFSNSYKTYSIEFPIDSKLRKIERNGFRNCFFEEIKIPSTVKIICSNAFRNCCNLRHIEIPENSELQTIEQKAFYSCDINELSFPSGLINLEEGWCHSMNGLTKIIISPNNPKYSIYDEKFIIGKSSIEKENFDVLVFCSRDIITFKIPDFIEIIGPYSFSSCRRLEYVEISADSKLRIIDKCAFSCSSIENILISSQIIEICEGAFSECKQIQKIEILHDSNLQIIGKNAFLRSSINSFVVPSKLTEINEKAFYESKLRQIEFCEDSKIQKIGKGAFAHTLIETIKIPSSVTIIDETAFSECHQLKKIEFDEDSKIQMIGKNVFLDSSLEEFTIPSGLVNLEDCFCVKNLIKVNVMPNNPKYSLFEDKFIVGKSSIEQENYDVLVFCIRNVKTVRIPEFIEIIGSYAFFSCKQLKNIEIPTESKLRIIEKFAFNNSGITKIKMPSKLIKIGEKSFSLCEKLRIIEIPSNSELKAIQSNAFVDDSSLESISIPSKLTQIQSQAFYNCKKLRRVDFAPNSQLQTISKFSFAETSICSIIMPPKVETIEMSAFNKCSFMQIIEIDENSELKQILRQNFQFYCFHEIVIMIPVKLNNNFSFR